VHGESGVSIDVGGKQSALIKTVGYVSPVRHFLCEVSCTDGILTLDCCINERTTLLRD
jgi:hypothetical protein